MNRRWRASVFACLVVLATMAWTPYASAAIVTDPSSLSQSAADSCAALPAPAYGVAWRWPSEDEPRHIHPWSNLLARDGTGSTSSPTSGGSSISIQSAMVVMVYRPPPPLAARLMAGSGLVFPAPPPFEVLHVPRRARIAA